MCSTQTNTRELLYDSPSAIMFSSLPRLRDSRQTTWKPRQLSWCTSIAPVLNGSTTTTISSRVDTAEGGDWAASCCAASGAANCIDGRLYSDCEWEILCEWKWRPARFDTQNVSW